MSSSTLTIDEAQQLCVQAFEHAGTSSSNAVSTARALVAAEVDGQKGHGLSRVSSYAAQVSCGKVNGRALPKVDLVADAALRIDADTGFAYPAIDAAIERLPDMAKQSGIAVAAIHNSHHFGQAGAHVERLADKGLVALLFGNSPKAMAFWGGAKSRMGTNPIAFAAPLPDQPSLVVDLALSVAARGKIMAAQKEGLPIPEGWAVDANGQPTTDPDAALGGAMLAIGGAKGGALALMVEILAAALTGGAFGWQANSVLNAEGAPPNLGQLFIAIDPDVLSGGTFPSRMGELLQSIAEEPEVRLPGMTRLKNRENARTHGLQVSSHIMANLEETHS